MGYPNSETGARVRGEVVGDELSECTQLLACPFCGARAEHRNVQEGLAWWVTCTGDCMCEIGTERSKEAATNVWNTRAS